MRKIQIIIIISLITLASCLFRPRRLTTKVQTKMYFPEELRDPDQNKHSNWQVPNEKFCSEMQLQPAQHYLVLPWWYNFCAKFYEKDEKKYSKSVYNLALYRNVLSQLLSYQKMKKQQGG